MYIELILSEIQLIAEIFFFHFSHLTFIYYLSYPLW